MSDLATRQAVGANLDVRYALAQSPDQLADDVLAEVSFGSDQPPSDDPRRIHIGLEALHGAGLREIWRASGAVRCGQQGNIRYCEDEHLLFGMIELDEHDYTDIKATATAAYDALIRFQSNCPKPHLMRIWNYFDAITQGEGESERYKMFCAGRAAGLGEHQMGTLPAATAIGRRDGSSVLQVYWLAAAKSGDAVENPRQISAYHYPHQYGRVSPRFARATLHPSGELLISGTASVVGHSTNHPDCVQDQLNETLINLDTLLHQAQIRRAGSPSQFTARALLKVYLRHPQACAAVVETLQARLPAGVQFIVLAADVCRDDLLIEIDGLNQ